MTDAERLESIKFLMDSNLIQLRKGQETYNTVKWLIEKAEQLEIVKDTSKNFEQAALNYAEENKKLREALDFILNIDDHPKFKNLILEHNDLLSQLSLIEDKARQTLEGLK